MKNIN
jgi:hypothetical protein